MVFFVLCINIFIGLVCGFEDDAMSELSLFMKSRSNTSVTPFEEEQLRVTHSLVTQMQAHEFYFLVQEETKGELLSESELCNNYEFYNAGIGRLLSEIWESKMTSVKIVHYGNPGNTDSWMSAIGKALKPGDVRVVILLLDEETTLAVFSKIKSKNLETEYLNWIVVSKKIISTRLRTILREGYQIIAVEKQTENVTALSVMKSFIAVDNSVRFAEVGKVRCDRVCKISRSTTLVDPLRESYRDFRGRKLTAAAVHNWPFFVLYTRPDGIRTAQSGIDFNILEILASKLNFTYNVTEPLDGQWGQIFDNGTVTGMIGTVYRREAHFAIDEITILGARESVVDFTAPYYTEPTTLVSSAPQKMSQAWQTFSPFTLEVWIILTITTSISGPFLYAFYKITPDKQKGTSFKYVQNFSFETFRALMRQDRELKLRSCPGRIILFSWLLFCFIISVSYSTTLHAVLVVPSMEKPIDSLSDLIHACEKKGTGIILALGTSNEALFKEATSGMYKRLWDFFDPLTGYVVDRVEGLVRVLEGDNVYVNAHLHSEIQATKYGRENFYLARQTFYPQSYGIACQSGAPFKAIFNEILIRLSESGLISKWSQDIINEVAHKISNTPEDKNDATKKAKKRTKRHAPLSLENLQGAFIIMAIGFFVASVIFVTEILMNKVDTKF